MKLNKLFLALLCLILISSIGIAVAEDASVGGYTFTVPEGYSIYDETDTMVVMQADENNAITFTTEIADDIEASKQNFISQGKELVEEDTIDYYGTEINLQAFYTPENSMYAYNYIVLSDDGNILVCVATDNADFDSDLDDENNPAGAIFDSLSME